jgi:hypothetical protein
MESAHEQGVAVTAKAPDKTPPKIAPPCDVPGCGHTAVLRTDGTEKDVQGLGRPAIAGLNVCGHHENWPHSPDAKVFAAYR